MRRWLLILSFCSVLWNSCSRERVIPTATLADIYEEMYLLDQSVMKHRPASGLTDTLKIYEPILEKYGYTVEDYYLSLKTYLKRPDKFEDVFDICIRNLEARKAALESIIRAEERSLEVFRFRDSVLTAVCDSSRSDAHLRALEMLFFEKDTTLITDSPVPDTSAVFSYRNNALRHYLDRIKQSDTSAVVPIPEQDPDHSGQTGTRTALSKVQPTKARDSALK